MMDRTDDDNTPHGRTVEDEAVEMGGETTAAATGPTEIDAARGETNGASDVPSVGADTMVKVADEPDSKTER